MLHLFVNSSPFMGRWRPKAAGGAASLIRHVRPLTPAHRVGRWRPKAAGGAASMLTSCICCYCPDVALVPERVVLVFLAEVADRGVDHPAGRIAEAAQAPPVLQPVRDADQRVEL